MRAMQLYGFAEVPFDDSGRFVMPDHLADLCAIDDALFFQAAGAFFTIWNPDELCQDGRRLGRRAGGLRAMLADERGKAAQVMRRRRTFPSCSTRSIAALAPAPGEVIVDATFGAGGYTRALLDAGATVHAFDRDPDAIAAGQHLARNRGKPAAAGAPSAPLLRNGRRARRGRDRAGRRGGDGYRRVVDAARPGGARLRLLRSTARSTCA